VASIPRVGVATHGRRRALFLRLKVRIEGGSVAPRPCAILSGMDDIEISKMRFDNDKPGELDRARETSRNMRTGRTVLIEVRQDGECLGMILAPYGVDEEDSSYDDMGGNSSALIDEDGMKLEEKIEFLNKSLDEKLRGL
jgi:hypothetical protein